MTQQTKRWFNFKNLSSDMPVLDIFDEIGGWGTWASDVIEVLDSITAPQIKVRLYSPGGYIDEGMQIYNALRRHPARVLIEIDSQAASIASVIAMAGDEIRMADTAFMMIHDPWSGVMGDAQEMRKQADVLDQLKAAIVLAYAKRTGLEASKIEDMMKAETWMIAADAVELGFADAVDDMVQSVDSLSVKQASFSNKIMNSFKHIPESLGGMFGATPSAALMLSPKQAQEESAAAGKAGAMPDKTKKMEVIMKDDDKIAAPVDAATVRQDALREERARMSEITARASLAHNLVGKDMAESLARKAIESGSSCD
ncbi:MAG: Clp protease ClpP, partial [Mariprofundaceae bacterium]|nr:Clp protease ClpP [Mariprofundaceae bacterium]